MLDIDRQAMFTAGYRLAKEGYWIGEAYGHDRIMRGDIPKVSDDWYRGHRAAVIARWCGVDLSLPE